MHECNYIFLFLSGFVFYILFIFKFVFCLVFVCMYVCFFLFFFVYCFYFCYFRVKHTHLDFIGTEVVLVLGDDVAGWAG